MYKKRFRVNASFIDNKEYILKLVDLLPHES
jgi:hypothetical protein